MVFSVKRPVLPCSGEGAAPLAAWLSCERKKRDCESHAFADLTFLRTPGEPEIAFPVLPAALVVRDTFRFRGTGLAGGKGQHHQGNNVGQHIVHLTGNIQRRQEVKAHIYIGQRPEQAEQQRRQRDADGFPLTEDHNRQGQEAEAGHTVLKPPLGYAGGDEHFTRRTRAAWI